MSEPLPEQHTKQLAKKLARGRLALFVGAGFSHLAPAKDGSSDRLPLWKALAQRVADDCSINPSDFEDLNDTDSILNMFDYIKTGQSSNDLEEAIRKYLDDKKYELSEAHCIARHLPWSCIITTNYDALLERNFGEKPVSQEDEYDWVEVSDIKSPLLFSIHGTRYNPHTLAGKDYTIWGKKHPRAFLHLQNIFLYNTVLFVGYSLSDPHLRESLSIVHQMMTNREKTHYSWMWEVNESYKKLFWNKYKIEALAVNGSTIVPAFKQLKIAFRKEAGIHDIYLEFCEEDAEVATRLSDAIERAGLTVFSRGHCSKKENMLDQMTYQIRQSDAVVVVWSQTASKSDIIRYIMDSAELKSKTFVLESERVEEKCCAAVSPDRIVHFEYNERALEKLTTLVQEYRELV